MRLTLAIAAFIVLSAARQVEACGSFQVDTGAYFSSSLDRVFAPATTERSAAWSFICQGEIQTKSYVSGYGGYAQDTGYNYSHVNFEVEPVFTGVHFTHSTHLFLSPFGGEEVIHNGNASAWAYHTCDAPPFGCPIEGSSWNSVTCECQEGCPLLLDTEGDGIDLTSREEGVYFDLDSDGQAELISWTRMNTDDGWLVLDRNGNGRIDNGRELFGNFSSIYPDQLYPIANHGFDALEALESSATWGPHRRDGKIDARDSMYSRLQVWRDIDHDGASDAGELVSLESLGVVSLGTDYKATRQRDEHGNVFKFKAPSYWQLPNGKVKKRTFWDVYLLIQ